MARIRVLPENIARQIAAGEVVERPASVVKELIENALDAGARSIFVRTRGAGGTLIEVRDDGCGMSADDLPLAVKSFSTSKIAEPDDLFRIVTYGFRGEALASISSVCRFEITSSDSTAGEGWSLSVDGKSVTESRPAPHERGTTVAVRDLFYNTPARKKFLKSQVTERRRILDIVMSFALIDPGLEIHYSEDDRPVLDLVPSTTWRGRVASILGSSTMEHMVDVEYDAPPFRFRGIVSLPTHTRANRTQQFFYVNRRLVKEKTILSAVHEAYRSVIPPRRFPVTVLSLAVPSQDVDVNVHPTKIEVRLTNPRNVFDTVRKGIKQALSSRSESSLKVNYASPSALGYDPSPSLGPQSVRALSGALAPSTTDGDPAEEGYRARVRDAVSSYMKGAASVAPLNPQLSLQIEEKGQTESAETAPDDKVLGEEGLFWQFNKTYIFIQVRGGVVVIDQHAAHERIIYDTSKSRLEDEIPVSQQILFPINLELSLPELEVFRSSSGIFESLGFHLEPFGGKSVLVRGYPQGLRNWEEGKLLRQIFDDIIQERYPGKTHSDRVIASFACRSAVKAGQKLSTHEMKMLADQLFAVPNPYSCPHGRPTIQRISLEEIAGWFHRR